MISRQYSINLALTIDMMIPKGEIHYQDVCPSCRRKTINSKPRKTYWKIMALLNLQESEYIKLYGPNVAYVPEGVGRRVNPTN